MDNNLPKVTIATYDDKVVKIDSISLNDAINNVECMFVNANKILCTKQGVPIYLDKYLEYVQFTIFDLENENAVLKKKLDEAYYRRGVSY